MRQSDTAARLGGDEFTFILEDIPEPEDCTIVAQKILAAVANPLILDGLESNLSTSIGISVYPRDGESVDILMKNADIAMYRAKENRNRYEFYTPQLLDNVTSGEKDCSTRRASESARRLCSAVCNTGTGMLLPQTDNIILCK